MNFILSENADSQEIMKAIEENKIGFFKQFSNTAKGQSFENQKVIWAKSGIKSPGFNGVFSTSCSEEEIVQQIKSVKETFQKDGLGFMWWVMPSSRPKNLVEELRKQGFKLFNEPPCMAVNLSQIGENPLEKDQLMIKQVQSDAELSEWVETALTCFNVPITLHEACFEYFKNAMKNNIYRYYIGVKNCKVVSTSMIYEGGGVAGIYWVATLPEERKSGYGAALTQKCMIEAKKMSYRLCVLQASALGKPVYEKLGFKEYGKFGFYFIV